MASLAVLGGEAGELVDYAVKPNFRALGRRFGPQTPGGGRRHRRRAGRGHRAPRCWQAARCRCRCRARSVLVGADDVIVTQTPRAGWAVATDAGETVAIDTTVTPELRREGLAREVIRLVQDARKNDGLDVTDRIALRWSASDPDLAAALTEHAALIAGEVLAAEYGPAEGAVPVTRGSTRRRNSACGSGSGAP